METPSRFSRAFNPFTASFVLLIAGLALVRGAFPARVPKNSMQLTSTAFTSGQPIPAAHTCDGKNISPPLRWTGAPPDTKSFALIVDDPDAPSGVWTHWIVFDLPASTNELSADIPKAQLLAGKARQGLNDFKQPGYGGPCPPSGKLHH